jgi:putative transposase
MLLVTQAYRYALDPTPRQARALGSHCGAARFAFNWGLDLVKQRFDQRKAGVDVPVPWTLPDLRWEWNRAKQHVAPWWPENSKEAYSSGLDALARALKNWADSRHGRRSGRRVGFPKFKGKHRTRPACRFTTGAIRVEPDRHHITLPRIGRIKTHESTRKLARRLEAGTARIISATISRTADRWFVSFTVEVQRHIPNRAQQASVVGVDVGIRHLGSAVHRPSDLQPPPTRPSATSAAPHEPAARPPPRPPRPGRHSTHPVGRLAADSTAPRTRARHGREPPPRPAAQAHDGAGDQP